MMKLWRNLTVALVLAAGMASSIDLPVPECPVANCDSD